MDAYITIAKYTVKCVVALSVEFLFDKFVFSMNTQLDHSFITVAKMCVKLLLEVVIERIFETNNRQVQEGTEPGMEGPPVEGMVGGDGDIGEGVEEADGIV